MGLRTVWAVSTRWVLSILSFTAWLQQITMLIVVPFAGAVFELCNKSLL